MRFTKASSAFLPANRFPHTRNRKGKRAVRQKQTGGLYRRP